MLKDRAQIVLCFAFLVGGLGCGRVEDDRGGAPEAACFEGEKRLSARECQEKGFEVEACDDGTWSLSDECLPPNSQCVDGDTEPVEVEEACGRMSFNHRLMACRGGFYHQVGCACGATDSTSVEEYPELWGTGFVPNDQGVILHIEETSFPHYLGLGDDGYRSDLGHVLCAEELTFEGSVPELPALSGVRLLRTSAPSQESSARFENTFDLSSLRSVQLLEIRFWPEDDLSSLANLTEVRGLHIGCQKDVLNQLEHCPALRSLEGLERVTHLDALSVEAPELIDLKGLSGLEMVGDGFRISWNSTYALRSLKGLSSLRSVGGTFAVPLLQSDDIETLQALAHVDGDVELLVPDDKLLCDLSRILEHIEIGGAVFVNGEDFVEGSCK